jgi:hypothetical protein
MRAVITLLQKEYIRLNDMSTNAHKLGLHELYTDITTAKEQLTEAIQILQLHERERKINPPGRAGRK